MNDNTSDVFSQFADRTWRNPVARDVIAFDTTVDHPCPDVWGILRAPGWYPRFFHGVGTVERVAGKAQHFEVRLSTPRGALAAHEARYTVRRADMAMRLEATGLPGCFVSVRLTPEADATCVALRIFGVALIHPDLAKTGDGAVANWVRDGLRRVSEYLDGKQSSVLVNTGDGRSLQFSVLKTLMTSGVVRASRPDRGVRQLNSLAKWGFTLAGGLGAAAARSPQQTALIDRHGTSSYADLAERTTRIASGLAAIGFTKDSKFAVLARNHSTMVECMLAASKLGADLLLLNTGLAPGPIGELVGGNGVDAVFLDDEFEAHMRHVPAEVARIATQSDSIVEQRLSVDDLTSTPAGVAQVEPPKQPGKLVVLTSGTTTSTPKAARRPTPSGFGAIAAMLSRMPLRRDEVMLLAAPLFHSWGLAALQLSTPLLATVVLMERFDAEECLKTIAQQRCTVLILVPVMLQRILELPPAVVDRYDTSSLRVVASSGSPISGASVVEFMDTFGDILYNFYGSTEVSWATVADPADLRLAPTTAGRPPLGTRLSILDPTGEPVPAGAVGRIFVGNDMLFDGYADAVSPVVEGRLMDTGDLGYLDASGRLFVAGRADEMVISGGENVFPRPVEEAIAALPQVAEVAVVGVPDREFGQRLAAFVVRAERARLDDETVKTHVRNRLSLFSIPRDVVFVNQLPRNATGKVLKRQLADGHFPPDPDWPV